MVKNLVIWAHSECRSNVALFAEAKRLAEAQGVKVAACLWDVMPVDESRKAHGLEWIKVGDDLAKGREVLASHGGGGAVHVFCVYQNSAVWRRLIVEAKRGGAHVVVNAEAPCEMCIGVKALLKRLYYRLVLPWKVRDVARCADLFLNASGMMDVDRLVRLGWAKEKIVPFGYASASGSVFTQRRSGAEKRCCLRVLHTGVETKYRGVGTLRRAVELLRKRGVNVEVEYTGGKADAAELSRLYGWADVFVACGLCEPWGMRVNDAIHAGLPVFISDGMGAKWLVEQFGCGHVFGKGRAEDLAESLARFTRDAEWRKSVIQGVRAAHEAWTPEARSKIWLKAVLGE